MRLPLIIYILTALALVVVVLTRVRLRGDEPVAGRAQTSSSLLNVHTGAGLAAVATWTAFLITGAGEADGNAEVGVVGLAFFWLTTVAGLMLLFRWMPARGKRSTETVADGWSAGPGLSVLAHVGMLIGVCVFTWAYTFTKV